ncbi:MAG: cysteine desulfurase [Clostridia bacterium]|nr:cysteine desulfurase [Clostridia bacterium]
MLAYLDNSATTRPFDEVIETMGELSRECYGNPSSLHSLGLSAERVIRSAKEVLMRSIGAKEGRFIFTSGGTESDNLAILGSVLSAVRRSPECVTTKIEHPAVSEAFAYLSSIGADCHYVGVDARGVVDLKEMEQTLSPRTMLVSVMLVNNEVGSIQPIEEISRMMKRICPEALLHVDAVQAFGKVPISVDKMGIDLLSVSGHKIHGPKGIGGLYIRHPNRLKPIVFGGHQEDNFRSGTQNTTAIGGFAKAVERIVEQPEEPMRLAALKQRMLEKLSKLSDIKINGGDKETSAPHIINISIKNAKSEVLLHSLETRGVFVSTGSACSSNKPSLSPVLSAMGVSRADIDCAIRISLGSDNDEEQVDYAAQVICEEAETLRELFR